MSELDRIVNVQISKETSTISQKGFGVPLIVFESNSGTWDDAWDDVLGEGEIKTFSDAAEILEAFPKSEGYGKNVAATDFYGVASAICMQKPKVAKFQIGRISAGGDASDLAADLHGFAEKEGDFYFVVPAFEIDESQAGVGGRWRALPAFADESDRMLCCSPKGNANLFANNENSLAKLWGSFRKTIVIANNSGEFAWAAWVGEGAPFEPGSSTWAYKKLAGVAPLKHSSSDFAAITKARNWANIHHTVYGKDITEEGKCTSGEWIDIEIGVDWLNIRLQEAVYTDLVQSRKIPYDDVGIQIIVATINSVLGEGAKNGIIQGDSIYVETPLFADIPKADIGDRHLPDIKFEAAVLNAIHKTTIKGRVTL